MIVGRLIENAFFEAILPGFERVARAAPRVGDDGAASPPSR
jgi:hypothetical protein